MVVLLLWLAGIIVIIGAIAAIIQTRNATHRMESMLEDIQVMLKQQHKAVEHERL
ncbi:hypothetical protein [Alicyclobacillus fastidiosus]|uniref:Uncharacterized protein n=1 Tax=Alicyclobacillus fastidiosus TaxID=392011 RepID=A0ABV5AA55_9BACL|nr:hypothetical protein [Alicyclobacillus fastidiosus]WEH07767.1 hypothetical protein PYS47_13420 [Alicyclobacillus fastidiosus]